MVFLGIYKRMSLGYSLVFANSLPSKQFIILRIKTDMVLVDVCIQFIRSQNFGDFDQLIIIVMSMEKRFFAENLCKFSCVEYESQ